MDCQPPQPGPFHCEHADFVDRAKPVFKAAQDPVLMAALAFKTHHHIDHVFEHAGARDAAVLGNVANQKQRDAVFLGIADQLKCRSPNLADRARGTFDLV